MNTEKLENQMPLFGSIMPYVTLDSIPGCPVIALNVAETHFDHLQEFSKASMVVRTK